MDRIFLDANVLFSAAWGSSGLRRLWDLQASGRCRLVGSEQVREEARRNLETAVQRQRLTRLLKTIEIAPLPCGGLALPVDLPEADGMVLLTAAEAGATHLLTGDRRHFGPHWGQLVLGVLIVRPADYLRDAGEPPLASPLGRAQ